MAQTVHPKGMHYELVPEFSLDPAAGNAIFLYGKKMDPHLRDRNAPFT